jgi:hypothetical protein
MRERLEEEPEPEEEPDVETATAVAPSPPLPSVADVGREFEYRTKLVTAAQVTDGTTLAEELTNASADGWDLVDIISAGERHAILLRRVKRPDRVERRVGFLPPAS